MGRLFVVVLCVLVSLCDAVKHRFTDAEILEKMRPHFEQHGKHMTVRDAKSVFGIAHKRWVKLKGIFQENLPSPLFPSSGRVPDSAVMEVFRSNLGLNVSSVVTMMDITEERSIRCRRLVLSTLTDEQIVGFLTSNEHLQPSEVVRVLDIDHDRYYRCLLLARRTTGLTTDSVLSYLSTRPMATRNDVMMDLSISRRVYDSVVSPLRAELDAKLEADVQAAYDENPGVTVAALVRMFGSRGLTLYRAYALLRRITELEADVQAACGENPGVTASTLVVMFGSRGLILHMAHALLRRVRVRSSNLVESECSVSGEDDDDNGDSSENSDDRDFVTDGDCDDGDPDFCHAAFVTIVVVRLPLVFGCKRVEQTRRR